MSKKTAIKGLGDVTSGIKKDVAVKKETDRKPARPKVIKTKATFHMDAELLEVLRAYAYQYRKTHSAVLEDLIEANLKDKVEERYLRH